MRWMWAAIVAAASLVAGLAAAAERLVLAPYPASRPWQEVTHKVAGAKFLRELIPADQRIEAYRDILTAESFPALRGADPATYLRNVFAGVGQACDGARVNGPTPRTEAGRSVAYGQVFCARQKGQPFGVVMFSKAIAGADALYAVQREFRTPPTATPGVASGSAAQMSALMSAQAAADKYLLNEVYLCADRSADPRCAAR